MDSFVGKHVLVLGLGLHGGAIGNIKWLASQNAQITVSDTKSQEQLEPSIQKLSDISGIKYIFGSQDEINLDDVDMVLRNPAVPRKAPLLEQAREKNIPVMMDSSIFFNQVGRQRIIGITGSKGKTTTSHAIFHTLKNFITETTAVGIDGVSPLGELETISSKTSPIVFEISSWRLEALQETHISPHIAVCTSIYKDHLNTYSSYEEYIEVKKQIIKDQTHDDIAILNYDDEIIRTWEKDVKGQLYWYSLKPLPEHGLGIWVDGGDVKTNWNNQEQTICTALDIPHSSPHELRNKLPAILIALLHSAMPQQITSALKAIPQLKHRMQLVREIGGVKYINDTTATMPDATIAALKSIQENPLILILGGSDKALEFQNLAQQISQQKNLKHLIWLPGTATDRMKQEILPVTPAHSYYASSMEEVVSSASEFAKEGDTVLLSPGATSFGLFLHEFDRGDAFIEAVEKLKK
ncbi:MAG: UDP-N-acetylmuramoyl-L-alanine--D-glutamate ligase [Candidatus Andersenbacteria bacterium]|nr:UDP-N-acetylmuramoyl-L-alanine--D-glutamate ligase [Candidatus Andersenbacteria bacterium]